MTEIIKHQTQPCPISCVSTCMAMIAGIPAAEMIERFHNRYRETDLSIGDMLRDLGIPFRDFRSSDRNSLVDDGVWLLGVPSLNIQGGGHQIVVVMDDGEWWVFDPNQGREGRLFYSHLAELPDGAVLLQGGYNADAVIDIADLKAWRTGNGHG